MVTTDDIKNAIKDQLVDNAEDTNNDSGKGESLSMEQIREEMNKAMTAYRRQIEKDSKKNNDTIIAAVLAAVGKKPTDKEEPNTETLTIKQQLAELQEYRKQTELEKQNTARDNLFKTHLSSNGINKHQKLALGAIKDDIKYDKESGEYQFFINGVPYDLEKGFELFAQSEEGKACRDKVDIKGSGSQVITSNDGVTGNKSVPKSNADILADVRAKLKEKLPGPPKFATK